MISSQLDERSERLRSKIDYLFAQVSQKDVVGDDQQQHHRCALFGEELQKTLQELLIAEDELFSVLKIAEKERKVLLSSLVSRQEEESLRISRELHDRFGQGLAFLSLGLKALEGKIQVEASSELRDLQKVADELGREVHLLAYALRPTALDDLGLSSTLNNFIEEWSLRNQVEVDYQSNLPHEIYLPPTVTVTIYRVVQETFHNIAKHAHARHSSLIVDYQPGFIATTITDDGCGFDPVSARQSDNGKPHLGQLGMQERIELVEGTFKLESGVGQGTKIYIRIPLPTA